MTRTILTSLLTVTLLPTALSAVEIDGKVLSLPTAGNDALDAAHVKKAAQLINNGLKFLADHRDDDGGWSMNGAQKPAITALVLKAFLGHPDFTAASPLVEKGFKVLLSYQQPDGAIYDPRQGLPNYNTAIAVTALAAAKDPQLKPAMDKAIAYLRTLQITPGSESPDGQTIGENHPYVGGVSYGKHGRPDMNNLGWWMEAMHEAGVKADDPAMQRALGFVTRSQNRSESNGLAWAEAGPNDGGFIYAPAKRDPSVGESKAGPAAGGGLRSYGSISYVAWKSLLYAGLDADDPRVKAVRAWAQRYWTLEQNPNMPAAQAQEGLYFYYLAMARALLAYGLDTILTPDGQDHNWRKELIDELAGRVHEDGSFYNASASRWGEGNPVLVTAYIVQALNDTLK